MMKTVIFAASLCLATAANAQQTKVLIGGVDQRIPAMQVEGLSVAIGKMAANAARLGAELDIEKSEHAADQQELQNLREWVKAYFGTK